MPNHVEYDPGVPTFKHSDKFEAKSIVREMQQEAARAERAWEERCSQRDNNKQFFQNLNREEAALDLKMKMSHFKNREPAQFTFTETGEKIGTALLNTYNADLSSRNLGMKELRRLERVKARTERKIEKALAKKNTKEEISSWDESPPKEISADEEVPKEDQIEKEVATRVEKELKQLEKLPPALAKRLASRSNFRKRRISDSEPKKVENSDFDPSKAAAAAQAAMAAFDFSSANFGNLDASKLTKLMSEPAPVEKKQPVKKMATSLEKKEKAGSFVNMPSEEPLNIPGLPIGWKFGDPMPEGTVAEVDKPPVDESPLETVSNATNARRKRRPKQPLIFEADAMGALVDPSRFTSKNHIEQKNLTPRVKRSEAAEAKSAMPPPPEESRTPKVIVAPAIKRATNTYAEEDFVTSYSARPSSTNYGGQASTYGTYKASDLTISQGRNKYNRYKGGGVMR